MKAIKLIAEYLYLRKGNETESDSKIVQSMHRINRISLLLFLLCMMMMISKMIAQAVLQ